MSDLKDHELTEENEIRKIAVGQEHILSFMHHAMVDVARMIKEVRCADESFTLQVHHQLVAHIFSANVKRIVDGMMTSVLHGQLSPCSSLMFRC